MLIWFTLFADWLVYDCFALSNQTQLGQAVHFFVEDTSKIFALLILMIYAIGWLRASLNIERVRGYLAGKPKFVGYSLGSGFGAITPFCSCSSIPVFLGFTSAGIPVGITMAFLLTSPLINEVAILLLFSLLGWQITLLYIVTGISIGILGGALLDLLKAERWLQPLAAKAYAMGQASSEQALTQDSPRPAVTWQQRHQFAKSETFEIFSRVWKWVIIGVGIGAGLHGFVPAGWLEANLGDGQWWSVPLAVVMGIPLYANATGVIPIMESLLTQGVPLGTVLAFCMSTVAASFPEFVMLKQVMQWRLLALLFVILLVSFTLMGWILNLVTLMG
ncbi:Permease [Shewanella piezotolerans WP3]|uniref:Permease n=1 Tax=Shewanella piezotolerans (strain WP3 / JCM 13877) TaxID=225849 RepID=B8CIG8_SHEPW|nr:permease [Shewanella piezotolerans]ACJ27444.1 Permease [Shewanella piezotolerans WP3]